MARPKNWIVSLSGDATTIYWPVDTWVSTQEYAFVFRQIAGAGSYATGCSAAWTIDRILSQGIVSAHWVEVSSFAAPISFVRSGPASCFRIILRASGAATFEVMAMQSGPERVK